MRKAILILALLASCGPTDGSTFFRSLTTGSCVIAEYVDSPYGTYLAVDPIACDLIPGNAILEDVGEVE